MQPLNWILLTVILLEVCWLEVFRVLDIGKSAAEGWEAINVVGEAPLTSCIDDLSSVDSRGGYFFIVVTTTIVLAAVWLVPWSLVACGSFAPGALGAGDLLLHLDTLLLLLTTVVSTPKISTIQVFWTI